MKLSVRRPSGSGMIVSAVGEGFRSAASKALLRAESAVSVSGSAHFLRRSIDCSEMRMTGISLPPASSFVTE